MGADVKALHRLYQALRQERQPWESAWRDLADHFLPTRWRSDDDTTSARKPKLNSGLFDTTGILDIRTMAAGLQGGMTSPVRPWFKLEFSDREANEMSDAGIWLDEVTHLMQAALHNSTFYNAIHTLYADIGTFGTGCMIETADYNGLRFDVVRCGEYVADIGPDNTVDTVFRRIYMTARQIMETFGEDKVPEIVRLCSESRNSNQMVRRFDVIHGIFPRDRFEKPASAPNKPWASVYFMYEGEAAKRPHVLSESGFETCPFFVPRWDISGTDVYGRSPAMDVLSECRVLQQIGRTLLTTLHKTIDPPMSVHSALRSVGLNLRPGGVNYVDWSGTGQPIAATPIMQTDPKSIDAAVKAREDSRNTIHEGLYNDLFKMMMLDERRQITATEINARQEEKLVLIGPVVERLHKELFAPVISRTFDLMRQWDYLPPIPGGLEGAAVEVNFVSVLAQAQRITATSSIDQTVAFVAQAGQAMPEMVDSLDPDRLIDAYAENLGVPKAILRSQEEREAIRQARAQQQQAMMQQAQQAQAAQNLQNLSGAAKSLGQTPTGADGETALSALIGSMGRL